MYLKTFAVYLFKARRSQRYSRKYANLWIWWSVL